MVIEEQDKARQGKLVRDKVREGELESLSWSLRCEIRQDRAS